MGRKRKSTLPESVASLLARIEHWRETREKRSPMPNELWDEAVALTQFFGVYSVARDLKLNYANLRDRVRQREGEKESVVAEIVDEQEQTAVEEKATFVEIDLSSRSRSAAQQEEVSVEVRGVDGSEMRLRFPVCESLDVGTLITAFMNRGR